MPIPLSGRTRGALHRAQAQDSAGRDLSQQVLRGFYRVTHSRTLSLWALKYVVSFYNTCDEVWAVNDKTADVLRQYGYRGPVITMPNGTDPQSVSDETYRRVLARWSLRDGVSTLLFVGQMDFKKNPHLILRAARCCAIRGRISGLSWRARGRIWSGSRPWPPP